MVPETHSLADARNHLTRLVRQVERGKTIGLSRRGRLVAVVVSEADYRRLSGDGPRFRQALNEFLATRTKAGVFTSRQVGALRDRSPGRPVKR